MIRVAISVEGRTEEEFVKRVLAEHLWAMEVEPQPISLDGNVTVERLASDVARLVWDFDFVTSLVDFYGFRDKNDATREELEQRILETVCKKINRAWDPSQVFPYVQQYEFEGLLFSNVSAFANAINASDESVEELRRIRARFYTPEDINDSRDTAPSKRIMGVIPGYRKVVAGSLVAMETGLETIRSQCPRFDDWVRRLESLGNPPELE